VASRVHEAIIVDRRRNVETWAFRPMSAGIAGALAALFSCTGGAHSRPAHSPAALPASVHRAAVRDSTALFDANEIGLRVSNLGSFVSLGGDAGSGLEWPRGSGRNGIFVAGLWVGGLVAGDTLVTVAEYSDEYAAGPLNATGGPVDPAESDPAHRVYSIRTCDNASSNPDWAAWPSSLGAPVDGSGNPRVLGDQTLWCVFNDAVPLRHTNPVGGTAPLGIEVRQTVFGFHRGGNLERIVYLTFDIRNRGANTIDSAYVGLWVDVELGQFSDDLVGCDPTLDLGFVHNADSDDGTYGAHPPAVGCAILEGPIVAGDTLRMTSFGRLLKNYNEPMNPGMAYRRMVRGLPDAHLPPPFPCDTPGTTYEVSGDPVTATGCRDTIAADRRMMPGCGPFALAPGDSQRVVAVLAVGGMPEQGDRLSNLTLLRATVSEARDHYRSGFANVPPAPSCDAVLQMMPARPNPADHGQRFDFVVSVGVSSVWVEIHDISGRRVWSQRLDGLIPGSRSFVWNGEDDDGAMLPAGVYFVRIDDGRGTSTARAVRLR
jgi:FlgD Ig-like domain